MVAILVFLCFLLNYLFLPHSSTSKKYLRTFAPIGTAHFFAHVTHTSCIADHEGKHDAEGANIFHNNGTYFPQQWNVKAWGIMRQLWTQVFSEMSRNDVTVRIDNRFENFAAILLS